MSYEDYPHAIVAIIKNNPIVPSPAGVSGASAVASAPPAARQVQEPRLTQRRTPHCRHTAKMFWRFQPQGVRREAADGYSF